MRKSTKNTDLEALAQKLAENPYLLEDFEEETARALLLRYTSGIEMDPSTIAYIQQELKTNPLFQRIKAQFDKSNAYLESPEGKEWVRKLKEDLIKILS